MSNKSSWLNASYFNLVRISDPESRLMTISVACLSRPDISEIMPESGAWPSLVAQ
jgi:hypothetical protein